MTYEYRRICALLNRKLGEMSKSAVNHKRVYRIMRQNGLLLARHTGKQRMLAHEGKVVRLALQFSLVLRWFRDFLLEWPGSARCLCPGLLCREIICHVATTGGITGEMVRDLMVISKRFFLHRARWNTTHIQLDQVLCHIRDYACYHAFHALYNTFDTRGNGLRN